MSRIVSPEQPFYQFIENPSFPPPGLDPSAVIISQRPAVQRTSTELNVLEPDLVFIVNNPAENYLDGFRNLKYPAVSKLTYNCWVLYKSQDPNCWRIRLDIEFDYDNNGVTEHRVHSLYPWGAASYNFHPNDVRHYVFSAKY